MKKTIILSMLALSVFTLASCGKKDSDSVNNQNAKKEEVKVKKNKATDLPATVRYNSNSIVGTGQPTTIIVQNIESVSWETPTEENKAKLYDLYSDYITSQFTNLEADYQLIKVKIGRDNKFAEGYTPKNEYEKEDLPKTGDYIFPAKSTLVVGKDNISNSYPILSSQISEISRQITLEESGVFYIAVPKEVYKKNKNDLQLEVFPKQEDKLQAPIYIDIN